MEQNIAILIDDANYTTTVSNKSKPILEHIKNSRLISSLYSTRSMLFCNSFILLMNRNLPDEHGCLISSLSTVFIRT